MKKAAAGQRRAEPGQRRKPRASDPGVLVGWRRIAGFLGQPASTVQRWAKDGMPHNRSGRQVTASAGELRSWLSRISGAKLPVQLADGSTDLAAELRRGLRAARAQRRRRRMNTTARSR